MKTAILKGLWRAFGRTHSGPPSRGATVMAALLLASTNLFAIPTVTTLTGGWWQGNTTTFYGTTNGNTFAVAQFNFPSGLAITPSLDWMFVADCTNDEIRVISNVGNKASSITSAFTNSTITQISRPVAVAVDGATNVYYLNRGKGTNGTVMKFSALYIAQHLGIFYSPLATNLTNATALALDGLTNIYVTVKSNTVIKITPAGVISTVGIITNAGTSLRGITVLDNGQLALTDAGLNGIWVLNPVNGVASQLTGFNGTGDDLGPWFFATFNHPEMIAKAGGGILVVADRYNHKVKTVDMAGNVDRLYGVDPDLWVQGSHSDGIFEGWWDGLVDPIEEMGSVEAREPVGVVVASDGSVYTTEVFYHIIRHVTGTGFASPGPLGSLPLFNGPNGIALDGANANLFIADQTNNAVEVLNFPANTTPYLTNNNGILRPADVAVDPANNLYVLNQGTNGNGSVLEFDQYRNPPATNAVGLALPTAFVLDASGNLFVAEQGGMVQRFSFGVSNTVATVTSAGVQLQGIALFSDGTIVVSDAGNHVIWQIDPITKAVSRFTGQLHLPGTTLGSSAIAKLNQPHKLMQALDLGNKEVLVAADYGNNRLVVIGRDGSITNVLNSANSQIWFGRAGDPYGTNSYRFVPMALPVGLALGSGVAYDSEPGNNIIREVFNTGVSAFNGVVPNGTNAPIVQLPTISPNSGYYPMGQWITVSSTASNVCYTTDGTDPTTSSTPIIMSGYLGYIHWFNPTNDLTALRVRAFVGTNKSDVVRGQPVTTNNIGTPLAPIGPTLFAPPNGPIYAGIGSSIVIPIVCNLGTNQQIQSFQFRYEIAPMNSSETPVLIPLDIAPTNDFVPLVTAAQTGFVATNMLVPYSLGPTNGLEVYAVGSGSHILFQHFAVVALLDVQIPYDATNGEMYSLNVLYPTATSDADHNPVSLTPMAQTIIMVTNIPYTVGDSASTVGDWYNAGTFGNDNLDNSDVNQAFYASVGLRVPYTFSDVFNAMDTYPTDVPGVIGGDGQIRFLDWQTILQRSLRFDTTNWAREWSTGGYLINLTTNLVVPLVMQKTVNNTWPWYRQALVGATSVGNVAAGSTVNVPVYVEMQNGSTLGGLEFRVVVTPQGSAPPLTTSPQLNRAGGVAAPYIQMSFKAGEKGFGWLTNAFNFQSRSSNYLGTVSFTVPPAATSGQTYLVSFANADGAPNLHTQYDFDTRSACVTVNAPAPPASICSDEWKAHFFGSVTNPAAADLADPDGDGIPNWQEYLAGTDPTVPTSRLRFSGAGKQIVNGKPQMQIRWLTAPGKAYEVQWASKLVGGTWNTLGTVSGDGTETSCLDTNITSATRYYRLHLLQ